MSFQRILDVGCGPQSLLRAQFPDAAILRLDANPDHAPDLLVDMTDEGWLTGDDHAGEFDLIWMSHVLEHLPLRVVPRALARLAGMLAPQGQLHIKVPSLEWAAWEIVRETDNPVVLFHLYGSQQDEWQHHLWGYTLPALRAYLERAGLALAVATRQTYHIGYSDQVYPAEEHLVIGVKP